MEDDEQDKKMNEMNSLMKDIKSSVQKLEDRYDDLDEA